MSRLTVLLLIVLPTYTFSGEPRTEVFGRWVGDESVLEISARDGRLSAVVIAVKDPTYVEGEEFGPVGATRVDALNPQENLRDRPIVGLELLSDYEFNGKRWQGKIYDPESGKTYSSRMEIDDDGNLAMRGYIGAPLFGRTATFEPIKVCSQRVAEMLEKSAATGCD